MALIVYPTTGYDTYCALADADTLITNNVPTANRAAWDALADADKEIELRQATLLIKNRVSTLPSTLESDLQLACALLANNSVGVNMSNDDGKSDVKVKEIVGVVKTEYFGRGGSSNAFPDMVVMLLAQYEVSSSSEFSFERA